MPDKENLTEMMKLVKLYERVAEIGEELDGQAVDLAAATALAEILCRDGNVFAGFTGDAIDNGDGSFLDMLHLAEKNSRFYLFLYATLQAAVDSGRLYRAVPLRVILEKTVSTPQLSGIMVLTGYDRGTGESNTIMISKRAANAALEIAANK